MIPVFDMMTDHLAQQSLWLSEAEERLPWLLNASLPLLGPCTPLPALFEETLRGWRGRPVATQRRQQAQALLDELQALPAGLAALAAVLTGDQAPWETRLLAATLWAMATPARERVSLPDELPARDDVRWLPRAMACFPYPDPQGRFPALLAHLLRRAPDAREAPMLPDPLLLLCFLKCVSAGTLTPSLFSDAVLRGRVLHPGIAPHYPLRRLHRLLDYLGLSADEQLFRLYRQLVAEVWPTATPANWSGWRWVTLPGGIDIFPHALRAVASGERSIMRFHELRHALLPPRATLSALLAEQETSLLTLLSWLRNDLHEVIDALNPTLASALRWMTASNLRAAAEAAGKPAWWEAWLAQGLPAARQALSWLDAVPHPPAPVVESPAWRRQWLEQALIPRLSAIYDNLLLAHAASAAPLDDILELAAAEHLPAVRALALLPAADARAGEVLTRLAHTGARPLQQAARAALEALARRQGFPGADELARQQLLAAAWEPGTLAGERVRVGWQHGVYRLRLSLQAGTVDLEALGPRGPLAAIPAALRRSDAYRDARAAQRETQASYRLFRQHLEGRLLDGTPLTTGEFRYLLSNPIFAHLAERLLWRASDGQPLLWAAPGRWETLDGDALALGDMQQPAALTLTLPHPVDLQRDGVLARWQALAAERRLLQPFKQLFREIYLWHGEAGTQCARFAGISLDPRRAYALLRASGYAPGHGEARREWRQGLTAHLCWAVDAQGHDLFGAARRAAMPCGDIWFTRAGALLPLREVDAIVFSETLRDADLLTTQAAVGEALLTSRETIAVRALLLRETARAFRLTNIAVPEDGRFALVLGSRADYRVNLASGTVLLEPDGRQLVPPPHTARWRPAEDRDATSDLLALILTLAHDDEVDDRAFLSQL